MAGKIVFWSAILILGLIVVGLVAVSVTLWRFFSSEEGKQFQRTMHLSQQMEDILPHVVSALHQFKEAKGKFPEKFEELKPYMVESVYEESSGLLKYAPPKSNDPDSTVIMTTEKWQTIREGTMHYEIRKNLQAFQVTEQPLLKSNSQRVRVKPTDGGASLILRPTVR